MSDKPDINDRAYGYPGIYEQGSDEDEWLLNRARGENDLSMLKLSSQRPVVAFGLTSVEAWKSSERMAFHSSTLESSGLTDHGDWATLAMIDWRVRWCRMFLDLNELPYDREPIYVVRDAEALRGGYLVYVSEVDESADIPGGVVAEDPLDYLLMLNFMHEDVGYAAKVLAHWRRARLFLLKDRLTPQEALSLSREMHLMGETWAEANFLSRHGGDAVRGKKVAGGARNSAHATNTQHDEMRDARFARMRELTQQGRTVSNAASICAREGLGHFAAIRSQWYRHTK